MARRSDGDAAMNDDPRAALLDLLLAQGATHECAEEIIAPIDRALERYRRGVTPRAELAEQARGLVRDLAELQELTKRAAAALDPASELSFFLRKSEALARGGRSGSPKARAEGRRFAAATKGLGEAVAALAAAMERGETRSALGEIETAVSRLTDAKAHVLSRKGKPMDEARLMLGLELAYLWEYATGKPPTLSGEATPDAPGTPFGRFVALTTSLSADRDDLEAGFARFVRCAVTQWKNARR